MRSKRNLMLDIIRRYKHETGETDIDMHNVASYAKRLGWKLPAPTDPLERLAAEFSQIAREEVRKDSRTGRPYRANHAYPVKTSTGQTYLWIDIDEAPRKPMLMSLMNRREQIVSDVVQLTFDAEHWNGIHPAEQPISIPADFTDDVDWRKNGPDSKAI